MAKKLFFVAFLLVLAIVSVDLFVNVSADPQDFITGMMDGTANLAKGTVDTMKAGGEMVEGMAGGQGLSAPNSGSSQSSGSDSGSSQSSGSDSGSSPGPSSADGAGSGSGSADKGPGFPGLLRR